MGLDMYVEGDRFFGYNDAVPKGAILEAMKNTGPVPGEVQTVTTEVAYWRKANAIHKWFVDNVQGGKDECQRSYITKEHIHALISACEAVLADSSKARELLPPQQGFFFGDTEIGEHYLGDLQGTIDMLKPLLKEDHTEWDFYYRASW